jgi:hypothetical protein
VVAVDKEVAVEGGDPVGQAAQARAVGVGATDAAVVDLDHQAAVAAAGADGDGGGLGVLGRVGQRFGGDVVGGLFDPGREPAARGGGEGGRDW